MSEVIRSIIRVGYSLSSPVSWQRIPDIQAFDGLDKRVDSIDVTVYGDTVRRSVPGLPAREPMVLTVRTDPGATWFDDMYSLEASQADAYWRVEMKSSNTANQFDGLEFLGRVASVSDQPGGPGEVRRTRITVMVSEDLRRFKNESSVF